MKKLFFLFALLASIAASATVTVTPLSTDFINKKVTFRVEYANAANNRAWVWIDLCPVPGVTPTTFQTAVISAASATSGSVLYASTNTRGFFVTTNPSTVTATLSNAAGKFNWCAYGSDAPPNVTAANGTYTFKGSPPFILTDANGATTQTVAGKTLAASALTMTPVTLTDQTGYPGIFCPYQENDLLIDATHFCQQRTSGAQNWEAYIKDSRDSKIYRIVQMPDNKWYMAQNLHYRGVTSYCYNNNAANCNETNGALYPETMYNAQLCPQNWSIPTESEWNAFLTQNNITTWQQVQPVAVGGSDDFGLSMPRAGYHSSGVCVCTYESRNQTHFLARTSTKSFIHGNNDLPLRVGCMHAACNYDAGDQVPARCLHN